MWENNIVHELQFQNNIKYFLRIIIGIHYIIWKVDQDTCMFIPHRHREWASELLDQNNNREGQLWRSWSYPWFETSWCLWMEVTCEYIKSKIDYFISEVVSLFIIQMKTRISLCQKKRQRAIYSSEWGKLWTYWMFHKNVFIITFDTL